MIMARTKSVSEDIEKLIKRANQRLRQLEKDDLANTSKAYQYIMKKAQKNLVGDSSVKMFSYTRSGEIKFRTDLATLKKENKNVYNALVKAAIGFTEARTSTKIGMEDIARDNYKGWKDKGFEGSFSEWSDMWSMYEFQELVKRFGVSDVVSMASDIESTFNITFEDAIRDMYESGATSKYGIYEHMKNKYNWTDFDFEDIT